MKKITLLILLLCVSFSGIAQIAEGFETDPPAGWTFMQTEGDDPGFVQTDLAANTGTYSFYHNDDDIAAESTSWMISPSHTVSLGEDLSFFYRHNWSPDFTVENGVWISTASSDPIANPGDFTLLYDLGANNSEDAWTEYSQSLDAYDGETIYVAFKYVGDYADEFYIDDVFVGAPLVAPECAETPITPVDGATDVPAFDLFDLTWTAPSTGATPTSYNIYVGAMSDGSDLAFFANTADTFYNNVFVGAEFTTLYWSVRPLNGTEEAAGCDLWEFTTGATPTAPANDNLCGAAPLTVDVNSTGNAFYDLSATGETGEVEGSCFDGGINGSVWFTFVAPASGDVEVTTDIAGGTHTDTEIAVYEAPSDCNDASSLGAELGCNQDDGVVGDGWLSTVEVTGLTPGNTYYIQVDRWGTADPGYFGIEVFDLNTLSTEDVNVNELFTYFPNPVSNNLTIRAQKNIQNVAVYNILGQEVLNNIPNTVESTVDMSNLKTGAYFVKVTIDNKTETIRIIRN